MMKKAIILAGLVIPVVMACGKKSSSSSNSGPVFPAEIAQLLIDECFEINDASGEPLSHGGKILYVKSKKRYAGGQATSSFDIFLSEPAEFCQAGTRIGNANAVDKLLSITDKGDTYEFTLRTVNESVRALNPEGVTVFNELRLFGITDWVQGIGRDTLRLDIDGSSYSIVDENWSYNKSTEKFEKIDTDSDEPMSPAPEEVTFLNIIQGEHPATDCGPVDYINLGAQDIYEILEVTVNEDTMVIRTFYHTSNDCSQASLAAIRMSVYIPTGSTDPTDNDTVTYEITEASDFLTAKTDEAATALNQVNSPDGAFGYSNWEKDVERDISELDIEGSDRDPFTEQATFDLENNGSLLSIQ